MQLFNRKPLKQRVKHANFPAGHLAALNARANMIRFGRVSTLKETALHVYCAQKIIKGILGYHGPRGGAEMNPAIAALLQGEPA